MEHVDHDLEIIEHDPLAGGKTVDRRGGDLVIFLQPGLDLAGNRFQVRFGCCRTNHKKIGEGRDVAEIEDDDVFRFFVRCQFGAGLR